MVQLLSREDDIHHIGVTIFKPLRRICNINIYSKTIFLPRIYIIVKQLSKAIPTKKRQRQKLQKELQNAVATPAVNPTKLVPTRAETRPCLSANQPNTKPPRIAPPKKIAWAIEGSAEFSHTQFC